MKQKQHVTVFTLAQRLGLSSSTVSYVLNGKARQYRISNKTAARVLALAREMDYVPNLLARDLRKQHTGVIGLAFGDLLDNWAHRFMQGMLSELEPRDYSMRISCHFWDSERERRELESFIQHRVDGIICVPLPQQREEYLRIAERGIPLLFRGNTLEGCETISHLIWDVERCVEMAVQHLAERGRTRIGLIGAGLYSFIMYQIRNEFFGQLNKRRLELHEDWIQWDVLPSLPTDPLNEPYIARLCRLFSGPREHWPNGLIAFNDGTAFNAIVCLRELGVRIPEDLAVISMAHQPNIISPDLGLSTIRITMEEMGRQAAEIMLQLITQEATAPIHRKIVPGELIARESTRVRTATASIRRSLDDLEVFETLIAKRLRRADLVGVAPVVGPFLLPRAPRAIPIKGHGDIARLRLGAPFKIRATRCSLDFDRLKRMLRMRFEQFHQHAQHLHRRRTRVETDRIGFATCLQLANRRFKGFPCGACRKDLFQGVNFKCFVHWFAFGQNGRAHDCPAVSSVYSGNQHG